MQIERITNPSDLTQFDDRVAELTGVRHTVNYYKDCDVFACYDTNKKMIGGYAFKLKPPFRALWALSHQPHAYIKFFQDTTLAQIVEQSALWIELESMLMRDKAIFFQSLMKYVLQCDRDYMLYAYNSSKAHLQKLYSRMEPDILFEGELFGEGRDPYPVSINAVDLAALKPLAEAAYFMTYSSEAALEAKTN